MTVAIQVADSVNNLVSLRTSRPQGYRVPLPYRVQHLSLAVHLEEDPVIAVETL